MFLSVCRMYQNISKFVDKILFAIIPLLLPKKISEKYLRDYKQNLNIYNTLCYNPTNGICTVVATNKFGWITASFFSPFSFILAIIIYLTGKNESINPFIFFIILGLPILIGYIPIYRLVFRNDKNIRYVKKFLKKDLAWKKYWLRASRLYSFLGLIFFILGILLAIKIAMFYLQVN